MLRKTKSSVHKNHEKRYHDLSVDLVDWMNVAENGGDIMNEMSLRRVPTRTVAQSEHG